MTRLTKNLALAALATVTFTSTAMADRRTGMAGNFLIEDRDDIFTFPQLVLKYKNMVGFDFGGAQGTGNGVLTVGKGKTAFGILVNRTDAGSPMGAAPLTSIDHELGQTGGLGRIPNPGQYGNNTGATTIVDFLFGTKLGSKNLGFRFGLGHGGLSQPDSDSAEGETMLRLSGGITLPGSAMRGDLGFDIGLGFGSNQDNDNDGQSIFGLSIGANGRFYKKMTDNMDLGILGHIGFGTVSTTDADADDGASAINFNLLGGFGPVFKIGDSTVAGYGIVGFQMQSIDPSTEGEDDASSFSQITLPGFRIAFEHPIVEWLYFRAGTEYTWRITSGGNEASDGESAGGRGAITNGAPSGTFGWNAGLGVKFGNFRFDGALSHGWLNNGPNFVSGAQGPLFVLSSATFTW